MQNIIKIEATYAYEQVNRPKLHTKDMSRVDYISIDNEILSVKVSTH